MENKVLKLGGGRSTQDVYAEIRQGSSERWAIQSQKRKYVNGKLSGVIGEFQPKTYIEIKIISQL